VRHRVHQRKLIDSNLFLILTFISMIIVYLPSLNGGFLWDDLIFTSNVHIKNDSSPWFFWTTSFDQPDYWPLSYTMYWLMYQLFGEQTVYYHLLNIILHALTSLFLAKTLIALTSNEKASIITAIIFAFHPVMVETVAYIFQLKTIGSTLFFWISMYTFIQYRKQENITMYFASIAFFVVSLLFKTSSALLPIAVIIGIIILSEKKVSLKSFYNSIPYFLIAVAFSSLAVYMNRVIDIGQIIWDASFITRVLTASFNILFYTAKLLMPINLSPVYPKMVFPANQFISYIPFVFLLLIFLASLYVVIRDLPWKKFIIIPILGVLFYASQLAPALGLVNVYFMKWSIVSDHYQYLAAPGLIGAIVFSTHNYIGASKGKQIQYALIALVMILGILTFRQSFLYRGAFELWKGTLAVNPDSELAWNNLGIIYLDRKDFSTAKTKFEKAVQIREDYDEAHFNLGFILKKEKKSNKAEYHFRRALSINKLHFKAKNELALIMMEKGDYSQSISLFQEMLASNKGDVIAINNLSLAYRASGDSKAALTLLRKAVNSIDHRALQINLANMLIEQNELLEAKDILSRALRGNQNIPEIYFNLSLVYLKLSESDRPNAMEHLKKALFYVGRGLLIKPGNRDGIYVKEQIEKKMKSFLQNSR